MSRRAILGKIFVLFLTGMLALTFSLRQTEAESHMSTRDYEKRFRAAKFARATYEISSNGSHTIAVDGQGYVAFASTDAATVVNTALASALYQGGGKIVVKKSPAGYDLTQKLIISGDNVELAGDNGAVLRAVADMDSMLQISDDAEGTVKNVRVSGLTFDGNTYRITNPFRGLVWIQNAENIVLDDIEVIESGVRENYSGYMLIPQAGIHARNIYGFLISSSRIHDNQGSGIVVSSSGGTISSDVYIVHNKITKTNMSNATGGYAAISVHASNFYIAYNYIYRAPFGVQISGKDTTNGYITRNVMIGNAGTEQVAESGIEMWDEGVSYIHILHNYFAKWCYGKGGGGTGIEVGNTYSIYIRDGAHHNEIAKNIIDAGGYPESMATYGITLNGKYNKVYNNVIFNPNTAGIEEFGLSADNEIYRNRVLFESTQNQTLHEFELSNVNNSFVSQV